MLSNRSFRVVLALCCAAMIAVVTSQEPDAGVSARSGYIVASS